MGFRLALHSVSAEAPRVGAALPSRIGEEPEAAWSQGAQHGTCDARLVSLRKKTTRDDVQQERKRISNLVLPAVQHPQTTSAAVCPQLCLRLVHGLGNSIPVIYYVDPLRGADSDFGPILTNLLDSFPTVPTIVVLTSFHRSQPANLALEP